MLLQLSQFSPFAPLHPAPPLSQANFTPLFVYTGHGSFFTPFPILCSTSAWLFCNYLLKEQIEIPETHGNEQSIRCRVQTLVIRMLKELIEDSTA